MYQSSMYRTPMMNGMSSDPYKFLQGVNVRIKPCISATLTTYPKNIVGDDRCVIPRGQTHRFVSTQMNLQIDI